MLKTVKKYAIRVTLLWLMGLVVMVYLLTKDGHSHYAIDRVLITIQSMRSAFELYKIDNGAYPESPSELDGLYVRKLPRDPWNGDYVYKLNGGTYKYYSRGLNGVDENGEGDDVTDRSRDYPCEYRNRCIVDVKSAVNAAMPAFLAIYFFCGLLLVVMLLWRAVDFVISLYRTR